MTTTTQYCDSCIEAAAEMAGIPDLDDFSLDAILSDMGRDIPDHLCDQAENGESCNCACARGE